MSCLQGAGSLFEALGAGKTVVAVPNASLMHNHQVRALCALNVLHVGCEVCAAEYCYDCRRGCAGRCCCSDASWCKESRFAPDLPQPWLLPLQQELADQLAAAGYCFSCAPAGLAAKLQGMDPARLNPYEPGSPRRIAAAVDAVMGFAGSG